MKAFVLTKEIERVAQRCVWFQQPAEAVADPVHFIAHVLTYGTHEDVQEIRKHLTDTDLKEAIENAPAGVFDERSWAYWNLKLGHYQAPPMPVRDFSAAKRQSSRFVPDM